MYNNIFPRTLRLTPYLLPKPVGKSPSITSTMGTTLVLILVANLPHLTQLMPSRAERILELQDLDLDKHSHRQ
jgi:hypothetical protein